MASVWPASAVEVLILPWRKQRPPQATIRRDRGTDRSVSATRRSGVARPRRDSAWHFVSNAVSNQPMKAPYAILLPMACQIRLLAMPSRSSQTDSLDVRYLTHPHRGTIYCQAASLQMAEKIQKRHPLFCLTQVVLSR